jgi:NAD+ kinase
MQRVGVLLHPTRPVQRVVETLERWSAAHGVELVDLRPRADMRGLSPDDHLAPCDLIAAVGGDGTVLTALHAAARTDTPVLGVACGSLGALSAVPAAGLEDALDRVAADQWWPRRVPSLVASTAEGHVASAINDLVLIRRRGNQLVVGIFIDGELYVRLAGDGVVVSTPVGSSAYSMAAGGPLVLMQTEAFLCTPLAMHGGSAASVVVPADSSVVLEVDPGHGGFDLEVDGHAVDSAATRFEVVMQGGYATLVGLQDPHTGISRLRRRGLITDSPRVLARAARAPHDVAARAPE